MAGGLAVRANLLCVTWSAAQGHVFLYDLEAQRRVSAWTMPASDSGYSDAAGIAIDEHFHLYIADPQNHRVCHCNTFGRWLGTLGLPAASGGKARDQLGVLDHPHAVALLGEDLLVAGGEQPRRRAVQRFRRSGPVLRALPSLGAVDGEFSAPRGLHADRARVLVADTMAGRIQHFRSDGSFVAAFPCGPANERRRPVAILPVADDCWWWLDRGDRPGLYAMRPDGLPLPPPTGVDRQVQDPVALARDGRGRILVLDRGGERVQAFAPTGQHLAVLVDLAEVDGDYQPPSP
jgi:hypothetical protein